MISVWMQMNQNMWGPLNYPPEDSHNKDILC